jgi:hypothetical protein
MKHKILGFFIGLALVCLMLFTPISVNAADPIVTQATSNSTVHGSQDCCNTGFVYE